MTGRPVAVHVSPHPDDEILGAGATLTALLDAGWRVINVACGLGRPADHDRRRRELDEAVAILGIESVVADPPVGLGSSDDLAGAVSRVAELVGTLAADVGARLIISPHGRDGHHGHEAVARAVEHTVADLPGATWWAWGLWRDLAAPNLYFPYDGVRLLRLIRAMQSYAGENDRNFYTDLLPNRARAAAILGAEQVFGYGSAAVSELPYADLLTELVHRDGGLVATPPRILDPASALGR